MTKLPHLRRILNSVAVRHFGTLVLFGAPRAIPCGGRMHHVRPAGSLGYTLEIVHLDACRVAAATWLVTLRRALYLQVI